jgi:hypothetical protein
MSTDQHDVQRINALTQRVALLERQLAFVLKQTGLQFRDDRPPPDEIEQKVIAGDKLGAIRLMQQQRNLDLSAAKRAVEEIAARLGL